MDRGAWWASTALGRKELDMTEHAHAHTHTVHYFPLSSGDCEGRSLPVTASRNGQGLPCHNSIAGLCSACRSSCLFCSSGVPTAWPLLLLWGAWIHHRWKSSRSGAHVSGPAVTATGTATAWLHSPYLGREGRVSAAAKAGEGAGGALEWTPQHHRLPQRTSSDFHFHPNRPLWIISGCMSAKQPRLRNTGKPCDPGMCHTHPHRWQGYTGNDMKKMINGLPLPRISPHTNDCPYNAHGVWTHSSYQLPRWSASRLLPGWNTGAAKCGYIGARGMPIGVTAWGASFCIPSALITQPNARLIHA